MEPLKTLKLVLEGERPWSWNKLYAGVHHTQRSKQARHCHDLVGWTLLTLDYIPIFESVVDITVVVYFDKRPFDPDNITAKLYIDGLVKAGVIPDDKKQYVRNVTTRSEVDRDNPRVEILVWPAVDVERLLEFVRTAQRRAIMARGEDAAS